MVFELKEGDVAPEFCLPGMEREVCLKDFRGKWVVLYFYPKDNTPGCSREATDFSALIDMFFDLGSVVIGISRDTIDSHRKFAEKYGIRVLLLSDRDGNVIKAYGAWGKKKMYGKETEGIIRSTFIIDPEGKIRKVWYNIKVDGHAKEVLNFLKAVKEG
jgi:peroxiredoxin Q/BCP